MSPKPDASRSRAAPSARRETHPRSPTGVAAAAPVFAALGDATRLELISRLSRSGPLSIARLTEGLDISRQAVTKHLRVLEDAGLASGSRIGRDHLWEVDLRQLAATRAWLRSIEERWDEALNRLKTSLEAES